MRRQTRILCNIVAPGIAPAALGMSTSGGMGSATGIDLGFATTIYGRDAAGNLVEIDESIAAPRPLPGSQAVWPTEQ